MSMDIIWRDHISCSQITSNIIYIYIYIRHAIIRLKPCKSHQAIFHPSSHSLPFLSWYFSYKIMAPTSSYFAFFMSLSMVAAIASATYGGYGSHPNPNLVKPKLNKEKPLSTMIGVQGLVYCRSGPRRFPLEGNPIILFRKKGLPSL